MKAAVYYRNGGPEVFRFEDVPTPQCQPGEVLIEVAAISIEGGDLVNREIRPLVHSPHIVGYQCAGTIVEVGARLRTAGSANALSLCCPGDRMHSLSRRLRTIPGFCRKAWTSILLRPYRLRGARRTNVFLSSAICRRVKLC